jgi:uncharacterized coiled-coil protein SlyX
MNPKKCFVMGVAVVTCLIGLQTTVWGQELKDPNEEIKLLQEKIKHLENVVETQQNTIRQLNQKLNEQTKENERLKNLCSQAGINISPLKDVKPSKVKSQNLSKVTLNQLYQFYNEPITDLQKEEQYKNNYKGKWVQWTGKVGTVRFEKRKKDNAEHYFVEFIHTHPDKNNVKDKIMMTVTVEFDEMLKQRLLSFNEGDVVTYQGKLPDSYIGLAGLGVRGGYGELRAGKERIKVSGGLSLTDGRIVSP